MDGSYSRLFLLIIVILPGAGAQTYLRGGDAALQRFKTTLRLSIRQEPLTPHVKSLDVEPIEMRDCVETPNSQECYTSIKKVQFH